MKDGARWQFWSSTHLPYSIADFIVLYAISPCPWPNDIAVKLFLKPVFSARLVISIRGSAPGDKMKMSGTRAVLSLKACSRLNGGGSIY
jgi:hypothetical protein